MIRALLAGITLCVMLLVGAVWCLTQHELLHHARGHDTEISAKRSPVSNF